MEFTLHVLHAHYAISSLTLFTWIDHRNLLVIWKGEETNNRKIETVTVQHYTYSVDCALSNTVLAQWNMCCHQW